MSIEFAAEPERLSPPARPPIVGGVASLGGHLLLLALLPLLVVAEAIRPPPPPAAVEVELISPAMLAPPAPAAVPVLATPDPAAEPAEAEAPPASGPIEATQFFAGRVLAEEREIAAALPTLGNDERVVQLCNIEGLEQIRAARPDFAPDTLVAYAFGGMLVRRNRLTAPGAAFRSRGRWWAVSVDCAVAADYATVTAFTFTLGDEVPREQGEEHYLTAVEDEE